MTLDINGTSTSSEQSTGVKMKHMTCQWKFVDLSLCNSLDVSASCGFVQQPKHD